MNRLSLMFLFWFSGCDILKVTATLNFDKATIETNPNACKLNVSVHHDANGLATFNLDGYLLRDFDGEILFTMEIARKAQDRNAFKVVATSKPLNFCNIGKKDKFEMSINKLVIERFNNFGSIPLTCPARAGHYYLKQVNLQDIDIPLLPTGHYRCILKFVDAAVKDNPLIFSLHVYFTFDAKIGDMPASNPLNVFG